MINTKDSDVIHFDTKSEYKIGKTTYIVSSHYDENGNYVKNIIEKLLKSEIINKNLSRH